MNRKLYKLNLQIVVISNLRERRTVTIIPQFLITRCTLIHGQFAEDHESHFIKSTTIVNTNVEKQIINEFELLMILMLKTERLITLLLKWSYWWYLCWKSSCLIILILKIELIRKITTLVRCGTHLMIHPLWIEKNCSRNNELVFRALDKQSRDPELKTTRWLHSQIRFSSFLVRPTEYQEILGN